VVRAAATVVLFERSATLRARASFAANPEPRTGAREAPRPNPTTNGARAAKPPRPREQNHHRSSPNHGRRPPNDRGSHQPLRSRSNFAVFPPSPLLRGLRVMLGFRLCLCARFGFRLCSFGIPAKAAGRLRRCPSLSRRSRRVPGAARRWTRPSMGSRGARASGATARTIAHSSPCQKPCAQAKDTAMKCRS
jgi:hypothetical protein